MVPLGYKYNMEVRELGGYRGGMGLGPRGMVSPMLVLYGYRAGAPSLPPPHALYPKPPSTPRTIPCIS